MDVGPCVLMLPLSTHVVCGLPCARQICEGADKQLEIETKFLSVMDQWASARFDFTIWKGRDVPVLRAFGFVIEQLDESQLALQALLSMRHVAPFKDKVQAKLTELSDTADTLELWVKVQLMWCSLESVFMGGDIAKQVPGRFGPWVVYRGIGICTLSYWTPVMCMSP